VVTVVEEVEAAVYPEATVEDFWGWVAWWEDWVCGAHGCGWYKLRFDGDEGDEV
jgi:hypothetical protein